MVKEHKLKNLLYPLHISLTRKRHLQILLTMSWPRKRKAAKEMANKLHKEKKPLKHRVAQQHPHTSEKY
jgi:hypothetical protein